MPSHSDIIRGWWLENARIRYNEPERYELRHIRKDWYGVETDPHFYSGKIFILPLREILGMPPKPAEADYDIFHKILWHAEVGLIPEDVIGYEMLRHWPHEEEGVRDIQPARAKACVAIFLATERNIGAEKFLEFTDVYGVTVRTCVFKKASALSNWAVIEDFVKKVPPETPILLVTIADYDYHGLTGIHRTYRVHFEKFYPNVLHVMAGVFPEQVPPERLHPGDALYELTAKDVRDWWKAIREGRIPPDLTPLLSDGTYAPFGYMDKCYGIEMDGVSEARFLPTIVD